MTKAGEIEFTFQPRRGSKPICGDCGKKRATYDHSTTRRFISIGPQQIINGE